MNMKKLNFAIKIACLKNAKKALKYSSKVGIAMCLRMFCIKL